MKSHGMEPIFDDDVSRIRVRVTSLDQYRNSTMAAATTTTSSPPEKRTDSPKEPTTVEDEEKERKEGMDEAIQSALADDALIVSTTEAGDTDAPNDVDAAETVEGSGAVEETTTSVTEEAISETPEENASSEAANHDETSQELNAPESGAVESNEPQDLQWEDESDEPKTTLPPATTTTRKPVTTTPKPTKKPTQSIIRRSPFPAKKATSGRRGSLPEIPEAEEEEQSDVEATTQQVNPTSTIGGIAGLNPQTVYNLNANANSNSSPNVASVITPVNSIIDGIGPLILPLLGYTNRAVAPFVGRRVAGVRNYQPSSYQPVQLRTLADGVYQPANNYPSDYESNSILNMAQLATQAVLRGTQNPQSYRSSLLAQQQLQQAPRLQAPVVNREAIASLPTGTGRMTGGPRSRFVPDPAMGTKNEQPSVLATFVTPASPAMPEAMLRQEHSGRIRGTDTPYYGPQINYYLGDEINSNRLQQVPRPTHSSPPPPKETGPDPGYNEGRSNVAGAFFEDSGIMVNSSPATPPQEPDVESFRQTTAGGGFGGGRKPVASYEDVAKMPSYA